MEQVLYKLPEGWDYTDLASLCKFENGDRGKNYPSRDAFVASGIPVINAGNLDGRKIIEAGLNYIPRERYDILGSGKVRQGDLLFCLRGSLGKCAIVSNLSEGAIASSLVIVRPSEALDPNYLLYYFNSPLCSTFIERYNNGAAQPNLSAKSLSKFLIPLTSQKEQKRIVEKLDALLTRIDTTIEHLQESVTLADALYASSLDQVFEKVYLDYSTKPLSVLASKIGSGATPKGGQKAYKESGISLIRSLNVYDSEFKPEGLAFIDDDQADKLSNVVVEEGDVLLNITGASIARCCVAPVELLPARVNQHVCIIRPNEELNSTYLNYLLISPKFKAALLFQGAGGATRQALTKVMVSNLEIPLPPLEMQAELVGKVNLFSQKNRALKEQVNSKISDLITLKASILDSAFKGEL
ncbi:TPA: restriction endonuclease subunit S [Vibrio vulnificus]